MSAQTIETKFQVKLTERFPVAERTMAFRLEKPPGFTFRPGQYLELTLLNPGETDAEGNARALSIASAPHEEFLMVATRLRDTAFKRTLSRLPLGAEVRIDGPSGSLTLHNNAARTAVFIVGGIGITPVRSILMRAAHDHLPHRLVVFYLNRRPADAAFLEELTALQPQNPNYRLIPVMTAAGVADNWHGETGHLTPELLAKYKSEAAIPIHYVVGPPGMVKGVHELLNKAGVDDDDIRLEDFGGY